MAAKVGVRKPKLSAGGGMCSAATDTVSARHSEAGFSLLELVLSTGLAALMMTALMTSLMQFNRHKLVAQTIVNQQAQGQLASAQVLQDWADVCGAGVVQGSATSISLKRLHQAHCVTYDYGLNAPAHSLKRKRAGGRYSSFLAGVEALDLWYGLDTNGDCGINLWTNHYQTSLNHRLHQVWVRLTMRTEASRQLGGNLESGWLWHEQDNVLLNKVGFIWRVAHVCSD
ncbi:MAG TPA: type II secretion system protein [Oceanospirillaceae bacterium]|nr:type II secretion system protein [Oceanospirillaceae bacterium]